MIRVRDMMKRRRKRDLVRLEFEEVRIAENSLRYLCMRIITRTEGLVYRHRF